MQIIEHSIAGVRSSVMTLRKPGSGIKFVVFPMLHVADPDFYAEVTRRLRDCDLIVAEGIQEDPEGSPLVTWAMVLTYRLIPENRRSGLVEQDIDFESLGVPVICPDASTSEIDRGWRDLPWHTRTLMGVLTPLFAIDGMLGGRRRLLDPSIEVNDLPTREDELAAGELEPLEDAVVRNRDARVVAALAEIDRTRAGEPIRVAVVYGAYHVPGIVAGMAKLGYRVREADWVTAIAG
jgi:hypothetical protein